MLVDERGGPSGDTRYIVCTRLLNGAECIYLLGVSAEACVYKRDVGGRGCASVQTSTCMVVWQSLLDR